MVSVRPSVFRVGTLRFGARDVNETGAFVIGHLGIGICLGLHFAHARQVAGGFQTPILFSETFFTMPSERE
jgi:hypothetical protein